MITYHINPTVKKRWFKSPQIVYKLIKYTEEEQWIDPTYGNGGGDFLTVEKGTVIFSSLSFEEVEELRKTLNKISNERSI